jgi:hypothetical protein
MVEGFDGSVVQCVLGDECRVGSTRAREAISRFCLAEVRGSDAIEWCNGPPLLALAIAHPDACPGEVGCMRGDGVLLPAASS